MSPAYTAVHEIQEDVASMTITVGPAKFERPELHFRPEWDDTVKRQICGEAPGTGKQAHTFYCQQLGPKFNRRFQAANYYMWVGNRMSPITGNMLRLSGFSAWRRYSRELVYRANRVLPYVNEAEADGLYHLIPAIVAFQASPSSIKREVGKGTWKRIAANSRSRNMRIMQAVEAASDGSEAGWRADFVRLLDFRSGHLGAFTWIDQDTLSAARLAPRATFESFRETLHLVRDARRMLGEISPAWSLPRIKREHDALMLRNRKLRFSPEPFAEKWAHSQDGFTATLLVSQFEIASEGAAQSHCVASYANEARTGLYAVLRVEGLERATIGLVRKPGGGWRVDQVYRAYNQAVTAVCAEFARTVAAQLPSSVPLRRAA